MRVLFSLMTLLLIVGCPKKVKKQPLHLDSPEIEFPDDDELDDLPEAGDTGLK